MFSSNDNNMAELSNLVAWYRIACKNPNSKVLPHPERDRWKAWDDDRIWCSVFFGIGVKGGSRIIRNYVEPIEKGQETFELHVADLIPLGFEDRMKRIWEFGRGKNRLGKALGRFFSKPAKFGRKNSFERNIAEAFSVLEKHEFKDWFRQIDQYPDDRQKARAIEELPGVGLKVSRDFLNDLGMTTSLVALDIHVLRLMREGWGWPVPAQTPSDRRLYEKIEDGVRETAQKIDATVLEIDKAIYFAGMTGEHNYQFSRKYNQSLE